MTLAISTPVFALSGLPALAPEGGKSTGTNFLDTMDSVLRDVSATQNASASAEAGYAAGAPGASLGNALVASDRAEVAWNATVAVRNEVVSAYQSVMNMQF